MDDPTTTSGGSEENQEAIRVPGASGELAGGPERSVLVGTNRTAQSLEEKLDRLLNLLDEEVNIHPDSIFPTTYEAILRIGMNASVPLAIRASVVDRDSGRWLILELKDQLGYPVLRREWRSVFRQHGTVIDRPGAWR